MAEKKQDNELLPQIEPYIARANAAWGDIALIVGASLAIALVFLIVFRLTRGKDPNTIARSRDSEPTGSGSNGGFLGFGSKRRRRRRHTNGPSYEQRNPTRAEVGGLPPVRDGEEPPPPARESVPPPI